MTGWHEKKTQTHCVLYPPIIKQKHVEFPFVISMIREGRCLYHPSVSITLQDTHG